MLRHCWWLSRGAKTLDNQEEIERLSCHRPLNWWGTAFSFAFWEGRWRRCFLKASSSSSQGHPRMLQAGLWVACRNYARYYRALTYIETLKNSGFSYLSPLQNKLMPKLILHSNLAYTLRVAGFINIFALRPTLLFWLTQSGTLIIHIDFNSYANCR